MAGGELLAEDAGSPVAAVVRTEHVGLSSYRPSLSGAARALDRGLPLEAEVEREPVQLGLWGAVRLGLTFEAALEATGLASHVTAFRSAYAISASPPASEVRSSDGDRLRLLAARRVADGVALVRAARQAAPNYASVPPIPTLNPRARERTHAPTGARRDRERG